MNSFISWIRSLVEAVTKSKENILAFTCGDIILFITLGIPPEITELGGRVLTTMLLAVAGGIAGMIGKDLYVWARARIKKLTSRKQKP